MEKYISVTELKIDRTNNYFITKTDENKVFQIQSEEDLEGGYIVEIGVIKEKPSILINQFDQDEYRCYILSCLHSIKNITSNKCSFEMIKIVMNRKEKNKLVPKYNLILEFNTFDHIKDKSPLVEYISTEDRKIKMSGFFTITVHNSKYNKRVRTYKRYLGTKKMIDDMISLVCRIK